MKPSKRSNLVFNLVATEYADGMTQAAIEGLNQKLEQQEMEITELNRRLLARETLISGLHANGEPSIWRVTNSLTEPCSSKHRPRLRLTSFKLHSSRWLRYDFLRRNGVLT